MKSGSFKASFATMEGMKFSFVIPAFNEEAYLRPCLTALLKEIGAGAGGVETEVIVIDNASTDGTALVAASFPGVRVVREETKGLTHARKRGVAESTGDIIAFFDADTVILPGWLSLAKDALAGETTVCATGPYIYYDLPVFWKDLMRLREHTVSRVVHLLFGHYVVGGNMAIKKSALQKIGGVDTSIAFYGEDADLGRRLAKVGVIEYLPEMSVLSSARRYKSEGILKTTAEYSLNFLSVAFSKRPVTKNYKDIR
jgi:glycosyltransferase involved in cell wall biosynthesis